MTALKRLIAGLLSLLSGMSITLKNLFRRPVTQQYPREKPQLTPAFRSAIELVRFDETGTHDCVACLQCANICPSYCIEVEGVKHEGLKRKRATVFAVDYALCSLCGLCIDVCPTDTLKYSQIYDLVSYQRDAFVFDLLQPFTEAEAAHLQRARAEAAAAEAAKQAGHAARAEQTQRAADGPRDEESGGAQQAAPVTGNEPAARAAAESKG